MERRTFYGSPTEPLTELITRRGKNDGPPRVGDELCDGHQAHYTWDGQGWV